MKYRVVLKRGVRRPPKFAESGGGVSPNPHTIEAVSDDIFVSDGFCVIGFDTVNIMVPIQDVAWIEYRAKTE